MAAILLIDKSKTRREAIESLVLRGGLKVLYIRDVRDGRSGEVVGSLVHHPDARPHLEPGEVAIPAVHYRGGGFDLEREEGHYKFPSPIDRNAQSVERARDLLTETIEWMRDGGDIPQALVANRNMLGPIMPFGVLLDGFVAAAEKESFPMSWFRFAVNSGACDNSLDAESQDEYWSELHDRAAVRRLSEVLGNNDRSGSDPVSIMADASSLGWIPSGEEGREAVSEALLKQAAHAVQAAWVEVQKIEDTDQGEPLGGEDLRQCIYAASVGFHILAAGHL